MTTNVKYHIADDSIENYAKAQVEMVANLDGIKEVAVMPDVHPGKIGPIGIAAVSEDKIYPGLIGPDIGCNVVVQPITVKKNIEFNKLDTFIRDNIPTGKNIHKNGKSCLPEVTARYISSLACSKYISIDKVAYSFVTLGGGNHFIEIDKDDNDNYYITVHTGSRSFGKAVYDYYMAKGNRYLKDEKKENIPFEMTYLEGDLKAQYLNDVDVCKEYAFNNAFTIIKRIMKEMKFDRVDEEIVCPHNYITGYLTRKGCIYAGKKIPVAIPINMKEGVILGVGKGNADWLESAPHGAGRLYSRSEVPNHFTVSQYKKAMEGIHSSCINKDTLDEAPFVYRSLDDIMSVISETVEVDKIIRPVYNYKGGLE